MGQSTWNLFSGTISTRGIGFFTWSVVENLIYGDKGLADLYEISEEDFARGVPVEMLLERIAVADRETIASNIYQSILVGGTSSAQYDVICPSGIRRSLVAFGRCWLEEDGLPSHFSGVVAMMPEVQFGTSDMTLEAHCLAAFELARNQGKDLTARYLSSAIHAVSSDNQ